MKCWVCYNYIKECMLLPEKDVYNKLPQKGTYEIKQIDGFKFLYYRLCLDCMDDYLNNYPFSYRKIMRRELG
jgi:hypothetical protein